MLMQRPIGGARQVLLAAVLLVQDVGNLLGLEEGF